MFTLMNNTFNLKVKPDAKELKKIQPFIYNRYLSSNPNLIGVSNIFNYYYNIPVFNQYYALKLAFKGRKFNLKYPKSSKDEKNEKIEAISYFYKTNTSDAKEYLELINENELNKILEIYKEIKE